MKAALWREGGPFVCPVDWTPVETSVGETDASVPTVPRPIVVSGGNVEPPLCSVAGTPVELPIADLLSKAESDALSSRAIRSFARLASDPNIVPALLGRDIRVSSEVLSG